MGKLMKMTQPDREVLTRELFQKLKAGENVTVKLVLGKPTTIKFIIDFETVHMTMGRVEQD